MKGRRSLLFLLGVLIAIIVCIVGPLLVMKASPAVGAYGADFLRKIVGNQAVVAMETVLFNLEDSVRNLEYRLGQALFPKEMSSALARFLNAYSRDFFYITTP